MKRPLLDYIRKDLKNKKEYMKDNDMKIMVHKANRYLFVLNIVIASTFLIKTILETIVLAPVKAKDTYNKIMVHAMKAILEFTDDLPEENKDKIEEALKKVKDLNL